MKSIRPPMESTVIGGSFSASLRLCAGVVVFLGLIALSAAEMRTWTSADGARTFVGELQGYNPDTGEVTVVYENGRQVMFDRSVLSEADVAYLTERGAVRPPSAGSGSRGGGLDPGAIGFGLEGYDGRGADMSRPVQVFILLGQSNMLGFGRISGGDGSLEHAVREKGLYPYLVDAEGNWVTRNDVRNVRVMQRRGMELFNNEFMSIDAYHNIRGKAIGPEIGIGHYLGNAMEAPVLILKSCIGNRSLGWDLLPPGSERFEHGGKVYAGYKDPQSSWEKGTDPKEGSWYAGKQYDDDIGNARQVLANLATYYPGAKNFEVAGFFWWQGDKDMRDAVHASRYEQNLVRLIKRLRTDFDAPDAKFVCATLGQTKKGDGGGQGDLLKAKMAVDGGSGKYPEFKGNVATVYTHPLSKGGSSSGHYNNNAETYMNVGEAMGEAMVELLIGKR